MTFYEDIPIWRQIEEMVCRKISGGEWPAGQRIPSVRELAAELAVNPNTVMRSYEHSVQRGILENRRGVGFFVAETAPVTILEEQRKALIQEELPALFERMRRLGVNMNEVIDLYKDRYENK